jgi:hypothetical protein
MEIDENNVPEEQDDDYVEIYSKSAIWWFSLFSPLFGSILLMMNLWAAGFKSIMYRVVVFLFLFAAVSNILITKLLPGFKIGPNPDIEKLLILLGINLGLNILAALVLTFYFFKRYFPDDDYYPKSVQTPVLILLSITLFSMLIGYGI